MGIKSTTVESIKNALENRVWFNYPGQTLGGPHTIGSFDQPAATARVLDNGTTQVSFASYDSAHYYLPTQIVDPLGRTTGYTYASNAIDLSAVTQTANGAATTIDSFPQYNSQHEPLSHTDALGQTTQFTYNPVGQLLTVKDPLGDLTRYYYYASNDLKSVLNADSQIVAQYTYDGFDRVQTFTDCSAPDQSGSGSACPSGGNGSTVTYTYDNLDRVTTVAYLDGTHDAYSYAASAPTARACSTLTAGAQTLDLQTYTDRLNRTWTYGYDCDRRLVEMDDPAGKATTFAFGYDSAGETVARTDPRGQTTSWQYDVESRLARKTYADNSTASVTYEQTTSRVASVRDVGGGAAQSKTFGYYLDNRLASVSYASSGGVTAPTPSVAFQYDPNFPRLTARTDTLSGAAQTTTYGYWPVGAVGALQVQAETQPLASIAYGYDALGRLAARTVSGQGPESFGYDALGRLHTHANDLGAFTLAYNGESGQIASRSAGPLSTVWSYQPNASDRRLAGVATSWALTGQMTAFAYGTNAENEIGAITQTSDATPALPTGSLNQVADYTGNPLNELDQLGAFAWTWDPFGRLAANNNRAFTFDGEDRLTSVTWPAKGSLATAIAYDGLGRRTSITTTTAVGASTATSYIWCGDQLCQARNAQGQVIRGYYAEGERVVGSPGQSLYYAPDNLGSVRRAFAKGTSPAYDYDPFGNLIQAATPLTSFTWAGLFNEPVSGLLLANARAYDPVTGRFISRDPLGEAADPEGNLYPYAGNDPVNREDPLGLCPTPPSGGEPEGSKAPSSTATGYGDQAGQGTLNPNPVARALTMAAAAALAAGSDVAENIAPLTQIEINSANGAAFQARVSTYGADTLDNFQEEVSIRPNTDSGPAPFRIRIDGLGTNSNSQAMALLEAKGSETASLTTNQINGFPLIKQYGGTIAGANGGPTYPAGTSILPGTTVQIIRPSNLPLGY